MGCIYGIPKNEYRHCKLCSVEICDERPEGIRTVAATNYTTVNQLTRTIDKNIAQLNTGDIPLRINGKPVVVKSVSLENDNGSYYLNIKL